MKKSFQFLNLALITLTLSFPSLFGQQRMIKGVVTAFDSIPLINATIKVKSTKQSIQSDTTGLFTVLCGSKDKLTVSANGFFNQQVKIEGTIKYLMVNLKFKGGEKNKEYAIGYGHISDRDNLNAISSMNANQDDFSNYMNMADVIVGKLAGVQIVNGEIIVRGLTSFNSSNAALIIIDGMQVNEATLFDLDPQDVQSIDVIKDGSAAIYGSRGANGVVLVETKRGKFQ